jgi:hypothetical protein
LQQGLLPASEALGGGVEALARLRQTAGRTLLALLVVIGAFQGKQLLLASLVFLLACHQACLGAFDRSLLRFQAVLHGRHLLFEGCNALA